MRHISFVFDVLHLISRNYFSFFFLLFCVFKLRVINYIEVNTGECIHMAHYEWQLIFFLWVSFVSGAICCCCCSFAFAVCEKRQKETFSVFFFVFVFFFVQALQTVNRFLAVLSFFLLFLFVEQKLKLNWKWKHAWGVGGGGINSVTNLFNNRKPNKSNQMHSPHAHTHKFTRHSTHTHTHIHRYVIKPGPTSLMICCY